MHRHHIFYLITRSERAGAQAHVLELIQEMQDYFTISLASGEQGYLLDAAKEIGVETFYLPSLNRALNPYQDYLAFTEIKNVLKISKPNLLHAHSSKAGILGRLAAKTLGIDSVFTAHGWVFAEGSAWYSKMLGISLEKAVATITKKIITVSDADMSLALTYRITKKEKLVSIHNGIGDLLLPHVSRDLNEKVCIICVARLSRQKNIECLLSAVHKLKNDAPFSLKIVGDGPKRSVLERKTKKMGLENIISFSGAVNNIPAMLHKADIFVLSSNWEGLPISIIEAMRAGLPVVATDVGGVSELVENKITGFLSPRGDSRALAQNLKQLLRDSRLRVQMGFAGRQHYLKSFTTEIMLKSTLDVYRQVLNDRTE